MRPNLADNVHERQAQKEKKEREEKNRIVNAPLGLQQPGWKWWSMFEIRRGERTLYPDAFLAKVNSLRAPEGRRWSITILGWPDSRAPSRMGMKGYLWARYIDAGTMRWCFFLAGKVHDRLSLSLSGTVPRGARGLIARRLWLLR